MPFGLKPKCTLCKTTSSSMWKKTFNDEVICNSCSVRPAASPSVEIVPAPAPSGAKPPSAPPSSSSSSSSSTGTAGNGGGAACNFTLRKSTRAKSTKNSQKSAAKTAAQGGNKGKSRRLIFKKTCAKAPSSVATPVASQSIFCKGVYYQVGDIVSVVDEDKNVYYAQITGLLQDQYCEKSCVVTWLYPTVMSPTDRFDPATFVVGAEEDFPRKMEYFDFVCHAPSEYFMAKTSPYPTIPEKPEAGFVWTRVGPRLIPLPTQQEVFGSAELD